MRRRLVKKAVSLSVAAALAALTLTGCRFGFASDPDDPNETEKEEPIDTSVDSFQYDASLNGTNITLLNSKGEIQVALEKMADAFEEKSGVHVEVMPVTEGGFSLHEGRKPVQLRNSADAVHSGYDRRHCLGRRESGRSVRRKVDRRGGRLSGRGKWKGIQFSALY